MCRQTAAIGPGIQVDQMLAAVRRMARAESPDHERPEFVHDAGWGAAWWYEDSGWSCLKSPRPLFDDDSAVGLADVLAVTPPKALLIHAREDSGSNLHGSAYLHPQYSASPSSGIYGVMHNGAVQGLRALLGDAAGHFDTADLARVAASVLHHDDGPERLMSILDDLGDAWTSGNAFIFTADRVVVINHFPADSPYPMYYTMHRAAVGALQLFSSEPLHQLTSNWSPLGRRVAVELELVPSFRKEILR